MTEIETMAATTSPLTLRRRLALEGVNKAASSSIKVHRNIKVRVADKNSMPPPSISKRHLILEMTISNKILATLPTEKLCSLPSKIGTKGSRAILTTAVEVDKVAVIGVKTTKVEVTVVVMVVLVGEGGEDVEKEISIIMTENSIPTPKTTRRTKNRQIKNLLRKRLEWKRQMLTRL